MKIGSDEDREFLKGQRVLITGSEGLLGREIGVQLRALGCSSTTFLSRRTCDLRDKKLVLKVWRQSRPSLVFHLAARVANLQDTLERPADSLEENLRINTNVVTACYETGVQKIVAAGSGAVYSDDSPRPFDERDVWRGPPHESELPYAHSKRILLAHLEYVKRQHGVGFCYLIPTNLYGPGDRFDARYGHVVAALIVRFVNAIRNNVQRVELWGDGTQIRDLLYAADAAEAFLLAARRVNGSANVATGRTVSIHQLAVLLAGLTGYCGEITWSGEMPGQPVRTYGTDILGEIGWIPKTSLENGLKRTIDWYRTNMQNSELIRSREK